MTRSFGSIQAAKKFRCGKGVKTSVAEWRRTVVLMFDDDDYDEMIVSRFNWSVGPETERHESGSACCGVPAWGDTLAPIHQ